MCVCLCACVVFETAYLYACVRACMTGLPFRSLVFIKLLEVFLCGPECSACIL